MTRWTQAIAMSAALFAASSVNMSAATPDDNVRIAEQVRKQIVTLPYYSIFDNIHFDLHDGVVELKGDVYRPGMRKMIERVTERVEGVNAVVNNIEILPVSPNDDRIRRTLASQLYRHQAFSRLALQSVPPVHIMVKNGNVTLEGMVNSELEKTVAFHIANRIDGVFSVTNNLRTDI